MSAEEMEPRLLREVGEGSFTDTAEFAASCGVDHQLVVGLMKSLWAAEMITFEVRGRLRGPCAAQQRTPPLVLTLEAWGGRGAQEISHTRQKLTPDAAGYVASGATCEVQVLAAVPPEGITLTQLKVRRCCCCCSYCCCFRRRAAGVRACGTLPPPAADAARPPPPPPSTPRTPRRTSWASWVRRVSARPW